MQRSTALWVAAAVVAVGVLAGCGRSGHAEQRDGTTILIAEASDAGDDALLSGTLRSVGGCLGIDDYVVVWPHGTKVRRGDPLTVKVPGLPWAALGEKARVGGGVLFEAGSKKRKDHTVAGVTVPASCVAAGVWMGSSP